MVNKRRNEREDLINHIIKLLEDNLKNVGIECEIKGRPKNFYSIYKKMKKKGKVFDEIYDLSAVRILTHSVKDCYGALGVVHTLFKPIPGRFKDYIAMPKPNKYQSLHTTVIDNNGETFEVQIRTYEMHQTAEYGIAAHWKYKAGVSKETAFDENLTWLRQLLEWQKDLNDPGDFMDTLKIDFFADEVFVFTPRGDVINLPEGSTPIDFAYRIHSQVGNTCVGAKVNGRIVPLNYTLQSGNIVDVITNPNTSPSLDWLKIVKSPQARKKIQQYFKVKDKEKNIERGKDAIEKDFYYLDTLETPDTLIAIHAPNFVIIMEDETEYWFDGFNCGYGGEGPSGTEDILDYWGILEKTTDNFRNFIASTSILHIINENNTWTFYKEKSHYRLNDELCDQIKVRLYSFNQKLILTQENTNFHYTNSISTEILSKYIDFIPQPVSVEFLSQERALESGHFSVAFSKTILYQIIIKDITDRELWIEYPFEIIPPKEQQSMLELLNMLDINITDKSFIEKAKQWLGAKPRWINHKYTKEDFLS